MANKVTNEDILRINELYYKYKVYAQVARETGFAPSTVKKYVIPNWQPVISENIVHFDIQTLPDYKDALKLFYGIENYGVLCTLSNLEKDEIKKLWEELAV